jgi:hypothetical protein
MMRSARPDPNNAAVDNIEKIIQELVSALSIKKGSELPQFFYAYFLKFIDQFDFILSLDSPPVKIFSAQSQNQINNELNEIRIKLSKHAISKDPEVLRALDYAQAKIFKDYKITAIKFVEKNVEVVKDEKKPDINWKKDDDYNTLIVNPLFGYTRSQWYTKDITPVIVKRIGVVQSADSSSMPKLHIEYKSGDQEILSRFNEGLKANGFPSSDYFFHKQAGKKYTSVYDLFILNREYLIAFLNFLNTIDPSVSTMSEDLVKSVSPYLQDNSGLAWVQVDNKDEYCSYRSLNPGLLLECAVLRRSFYQKSLNAARPLELLIVFKDDGQEDRSKYEKFFTILKQENWHRNDSEPLDYAQHCYLYVIPNTTSLLKFLNKLITFEPAFEEIADDIACKYDPTLIATRKVSFLMGLQHRLGGASSITKDFKQQKLYDSQVLDLLFSFVQPEPGRNSKVTEDYKQRKCL